MKASAGSRILWRGATYEVLAVRPLAATLRGDDGAEVEVSLEELNKASEALAPVLPRANTPDVVEDDELDEELRLWRDAFERIAEASQEYGQRDRAVAIEAARLARELGRTVGPRTVYRKLSAYEEHGLAGVVDQRSRAAAGSGSRAVDPRVVEMLNKVLSGRVRSSTVSKSAVMHQVATWVRTKYGDDVRMPSRATFYRLLAAEDRGRFAFGSAKTRESLSLRPEGVFGRRSILRPGEHVQIDTTRLDVMVRIDEGTVGRPELTIMIDVATRSILAAVLRPEATKSMDLVVVLARALVPYERRPDGARETRRLISTAWAEDALIDQERYEQLRTAQPFIFPETITTDNGRAYLSKHFRAVCETLGISLITAAPHTPTDKAHVERTFQSIASSFLQYAKGYVGRSVEHRGRNVESQSDELLTISQMQELLEDWVAVEWQNRAHDGLRDPLHPTIVLSPNQMCRAFRHVAPELHVPLAREDFIALLPTIDRRINRYGVTIEHRQYDSKRLAPYRQRMSPVKSKQGRWPIRVDPYNLHVVWLEADGEFIPLRWANDVHEVPMLGEVWRHARDAHRAGEDAQVDDSGALVTAMRGFAARGNAKKTARERARAAAVAADPMNPSSAIEPISESLTTMERLEPEVASSEGEWWPHSGAFPLTSDDINEVRKRLTE